LTNKPAVSIYRYILTVFASVLIMCCSGSVYAWSIFVSPIKENFGMSTVQTQVIFGFIIAAFTITMLFVGRIERRLGPRITAVIGAVLFSSGYFLASFSSGNMILVLLGISILSGSGMGFGYVTVLTNLVKWFPKRKGLATGIAVAGFGSGALLLSQLVQPFLDGGAFVLDIFRMIGVIYGILFLAGALLISAPAASGTVVMEKPIRLGVLFRDKRFWALCYTFFAGSFAGLMLIGNLKPVGIFYGISTNAAVMGIVLLSLGNAAGRILWGQVHDKIGGRFSVSIALTLLSLFMLALIFGLHNDFAFLVLALVIGLSFGANFVLYASDVSSIYGINQLGIIYPIISLAYGISGIIGPVVGGYIFDMTQNYYIPVVLSAAICLSGLAVYILAMDKAPESGKNFRLSGIPHGYSSSHHSPMKYIEASSAENVAEWHRNPGGK
jgi:OFA family oxalate/formate antiporter-like MFS transporter